MADPTRIIEDALTLEPPQRARAARELMPGSNGDRLEGQQARCETRVRRRIDELDAGTTRRDDWDAVRDRLPASHPR